MLLSARPTNTLVPSALNATACGEAGSGSFCSTFASATFHKIAVLSAATAASVAPLLLIATPTIGSVAPG